MEMLNPLGLRPACGRGRRTGVITANIVVLGYAAASFTVKVKAF